MENVTTPFLRALPRESSLYPAEQGGGAGKVISSHSGGAAVPLCIMGHNKRRTFPVNTELILSTVSLADLRLFSPFRVN